MKNPKALREQNRALLEQQESYRHITKKLTDELNTQTAEIARLRETVERISEVSKDRKVVVDALTAQLRRYTS